MTKCFSKETFYQNISALKEKQVQKDSPITVYIADEFFHKAKAYLKHQTEKQPAGNNLIRRSQAHKSSEALIVLHFSRTTQKGVLCGQPITGQSLQFNTTTTKGIFVK